MSLDRQIRNRRRGTVSGYGIFFAVILGVLAGLGSGFGGCRPGDGNGNGSHETPSIEDTPKPADPSSAPIVSVWYNSTGQLRRIMITGITEWTVAGKPLTEEQLVDLQKDGMVASTFCQNASLDISAEDWELSLERLSAVLGREPEACPDRP